MAKTWGGIESARPMGGSEDVKSGKIVRHGSRSDRHTCMGSPWCVSV